MQFNNGCRFQPQEAAFHFTFYQLHVLCNILNNLGGNVPNRIDFMPLPIMFCIKYVSDYHESSDQPYGASRATRVVARTDL